MAYRKPNDLDGFINMMPKADMRVKGLLAEDLVTFLSDDTNSIVCMDMGLLIDGLMPWLTGSHFKIAQKSIEAFTELIKRLGPDFNAYTATVLPHVIDRLGDNKDTVREKAQLLLQNLMEHKVQTPQALIDKLANSCFKHKNAKVREEFLQTIVNTLNEYGTMQLSVRNYIQAICGLLGDPTATVRDAAIQTLVEIYKHVGDRLRPDLRRIDMDVPATKLSILEQKFDQVKGEGLLLKTATQGGGNDEADNVRERPTRIVKRTVSGLARSKPNLLPSSSDGGNSGSGGGGGSSQTTSSDAGAVTVEIFEATFEVVPQLNCYCHKDMDDVYKNCVAIINDKSADWEKRVDSLKKIRSLILLDYHLQPQFPLLLKDLAISFLDILKEELRSQVIREACITIAYLSKTLRQKLDQFCFSIFEQLISLIQNSAKVIATSATVAVKYIVRYTHAPKLIKIITDILQQSKSKDIRAALCEVLCLLFQEWQTKSLERHAPLLKETLKKSIADADNEARKHSRRAFWLFRKHFPVLCEQIYGTLDIPAQRALEREREGGGGVTAAADERRFTTALTPRIARSPGALQKPAAGMRSVSAVDAAAAQRAKVRAQYALVARKKATSTAAAAAAAAAASNTGSLPRPRPFGSAQHNLQQQQQNTTSALAQRARGRATQSQPGSRSTSPSAKLREQQLHQQQLYGNYYRPHGTAITGAIPKKSSGIPRSLANSRETSPTRVGGGGGGVGSSLMKRSYFGTVGSSNNNVGSTRRTPERNNPQRPLAAARMLQQSRNAENVLGDALSPDGGGGGGGDYSLDFNVGRSSFSAGVGGRYGRKLLSRDESDDSEASSVCSERSFDSSYNRGGNFGGSRNRLDYSMSHPPFEDIETIIQYCASTHWSERKDGLISLTQYLADGKDLTPQQLQCVLDLFRKMFMDTHTKVYSLFLDAVNELILAYAQDLHDWLYILLTRLFNKLGGEMLNSMHGKIWKTLQVIHEYFPTDLQMKDVFRILADAAQTPNTKTKIAILQFLTKLPSTYCKNSDFPAEDGPLDVGKAVLKIVQLAGDQKSAELRLQARLCLIALYNCHTPQMTRMLSNLPKMYQDSAKSIIEMHLRRSSTPGNNSPSASMSPLSSSSPKPLQSPSVGSGGGIGSGGPFSSLQHTQQYKTSPRSRQSSVDHELLSFGSAGGNGGNNGGVSGGTGDDVQQNIHKTSEEIRNCFGSAYETNSTNLSIMRQYRSQQTTAPNGYGYGNGHLLNHNMHDQHDSGASNSNSKTQSTATTESNTPESTTMRQMDDDAIMLQSIYVADSTSSPTTATTQQQNQTQHQHQSKHSQNYKITDDGELVLEDGTTETEIIKSACKLNSQTPIDELQRALNNLSLCIKGGNCEQPNKHFRAIMKMLLLLFEASDAEIQIAALRALSKILCSEQMQSNWKNFLELIILGIFNCYPQGKALQREIDAIIPRIAPVLPLEATLKTVNPVIATDHFPINLCALKLLTELAECHGQTLTDEQLESIFPNLVRLADNKQSTVRKAAVFCIVKLYIVIGEEKVKPRLTHLTPSKVRLLNIYIERELTATCGGERNSGGGGGNGNGGGSSTKNSSASST